VKQQLSVIDARVLPMSVFVDFPRVFKGAIVALDNLSNTIVSTVAFQYNPEKLTRTLNIRADNNDQNARTEALRLQGAPTETINFSEVEIDATDQLEKDDQSIKDYGIYPQLSALEVLVYPKSLQVKRKMDNARQGNVEIVPFEAPLTLLVWGENRVVPGRLTDLTIDETAFDVKLNPIRAKIQFGFRVLSYDDLPWDQRGAKLFLKYHEKKEQLANLSSGGDRTQITGVNVSRTLSEL
jgi:hypothetical protein